MESKQPNLVQTTQLVWLWKWQNSYKTGPTASGTQCIKYSPKAKSHKKQNHN